MAATVWLTTIIHGHRLGISKNYAIRPVCFVLDIKLDTQTFRQRSFCLRVGCFGVYRRHRLWCCWPRTRVFQECITWTQHLHIVLNTIRMKTTLWTHFLKRQDPKKKQSGAENLAVRCQHPGPAPDGPDRCAYRFVFILQWFLWTLQAAGNYSPAARWRIWKKSIDTKSLVCIIFTQNIIK